MYLWFNQNHFRRKLAAVATEVDEDSSVVEEDPLVNSVENNTNRN